MKRDRIDLLLALLLFLTICVASLPFSDAELLSPDASGYLDMGRNLFSGKGPVISYNLYQFWQEKYYPFLPYTHPIFPIVAGLILPWGGVRAVIDFNIVLLAINCVMLYTIVRLYADYLSGFLITLFMGFSPLVVLPAIFPWTEQLHLFLLLLTVFIYLRNKEVGFLIGALSAVICIVRVAAVYNVLAFAIALVILRGFSKRAVREYGKAAVAFFAIFSLYELLCFCKYGALYPQYFAASETYRMAEIYPGAFYRNALPVLNMERLPLHVNAALANVALHLTDIINSFGYMKFVFILVPVFLILDPDKRRSPLFIILFLQGVCVILGCALSLWWLPRLGGDAGRFSLVPFITLGTLGFLSVKEILQRLFVKRGRALALLFFMTVVLLLFRIEVKNYLVFRNYYLHIHPRRYMGYRRDRDEMYEWIRENSGGDDLIASNFLADAFLLKRPFVSLPPSKAVTPGNVVDFLKIYEPRYVLTVDQGLVNILKDTGYTEKKRKGRMVIFGK